MALHEFLQDTFCKRSRLNKFYAYFKTQTYKTITYYFDHLSVKLSNHRVYADFIYVIVHKVAWWFDTNNASTTWSHTEFDVNEMHDFKIFMVSMSMSTFTLSSFNGWLFQVSKKFPNLLCCIVDCKLLYAK